MTESSSHMFFNLNGCSEGLRGGSRDRSGRAFQRLTACLSTAASDFVTLCLKRTARLHQRGGEVLSNTSGSRGHISPLVFTSSLLHTPADQHEETQGLHVFFNYYHISTCFISWLYEAEFKSFPSLDGCVWGKWQLWGLNLTMFTSMSVLSRS